MVGGPNLGNAAPLCDLVIRASNACGLDGVGDNSEQAATYEERVAAGAAEYEAVLMPHIQQVRAAIEARHRQ